MDNIPEDILKSALIKFPPCMVLKVSFPPDGIDSNAKDRANYIAGRIDERSGLFPFKVSFNSSLSWEDTVNIEVLALNSNEALTIALSQYPEYSDWLTIAKQL